jgi:Uma2 family endonuclease
MVDSSQDPQEAVVAKMALTLEDFLRQQDTKPHREYAGGETFQKPMPTWDHSAIQTFLALTLGAFLTRTGLGRVMVELRCIFGPSDDERAYVPDLCVVARAALSGKRYLRAAPDLAVAVLSPGQNQARFRAKVQFYLAHGVRLVWVVDPAMSTVMVLTPEQQPRLLGSEDVLDGGEVLPGFSLAVREIFDQAQLEAGS